MKLETRIFKASTLGLLCLSSALWMSINTAIAADTAPSVAPIAAPIATPSRPDKDKARDADRKPAEMLEFAKVMPGQTVIDYLPGKGYFTRIFSTAVGSKGAVYAVMPQVVVDKFKT